MPPVLTEQEGSFSIEPDRQLELSTTLKDEDRTMADEETAVDIDLLPELSEDKRAFVEWKAISCFVPGMAVPTNPVVEASKKLVRAMGATNVQVTPPPPKKQILYDVSGYAKPGEIAALMGPSGSGKTTLISVIGGRAPKSMTTEGSVTYNGAALDKRIRRSIGYVAQDDLLYQNLTVFETLYYAALLRLPKTMTRAEKVARVEAVIIALGLPKCRDTLIGGGFGFGVSGGERKRVSVGHELLINPSVLILDEPTSGLDSTTAMHLVNVLRSLARAGRAIITTIHQPSGRLFRQLSSVMLLSEGKVIYYGASHLAVDWFRNHGFPVPYGDNIADYILDISNGDIEGKETNGEESRTSLIRIMADFLKENPNGYHNTDGEHPEEEEEEDERRGENEIVERQPISQRRLIGEGNGKEERWGAGFLEQLFILMSRAARNRRSSSFSIQAIFQATGVGIITVLLWWQAGDGNTLITANDIAALIFFAHLYVAFEQLFKAIFIFPNVFSLLVKERTRGMYRLSAFYLAETLCDLPMDNSIPVLYLTAAYWSGHLRQSAGAFISHVLVQICAGLGIQTIGLLMGATLNDPQTSMSLSTVLMVAMMLVAGFWIRDIPSWMGWLKYLSVAYWAFRLLLQIEFGDTTYYDCGGISEEQLPFDQCTPIEDLGEELNVPIDVDGAKWPATLVLVAMLLILRTITYYVLKARTSHGA